LEGYQVKHLDKPRINLDFGSPFAVITIAKFKRAYGQQND
jgi:hypothetical protein